MFAAIISTCCLIVTYFCTRYFGCFQCLTVIDGAAITSFMFIEQKCLARD